MSVLNVMYQGDVDEETVDSVSDGISTALTEFLDMCPRTSHAIGLSEVSNVDAHVVDGATTVLTWRARMATKWGDKYTLPVSLCISLHVDGARSRWYVSRLLTEVIFDGVRTQGAPVDIIRTDDIPMSAAVMGALLVGLGYTATVETSLEIPNVDAVMFDGLSEEVGEENGQQRTQPSGDANE